MSESRGGVAVYPGSFDPITNGHLNIIERALGIFDTLVIAVALNASKTPLFDADERVKLIRGALADDSRIEVGFFDGLLVETARKVGATAIVRGLRAVSDFEYEFQMAHMNHKLDPGVETVFLMTSEDNSYVSSKLVKEVASLGGNVSAVVPPNVQRALAVKLASRNG